MEFPIVSEEVTLDTIDDLPERYRTVFSSYTSLNFVQSQAMKHIFHSKNSMVIVAPTGSGKTAIFELAIVKLLMDFEKKGFERDFKVIYVCPVKALCRERYTDWSPRFEAIGVSSVEITGDDDDYFDLREFNIVITTPEKWDSLTRKWRDNAGLVQLVKLFLIDEVHLLSDLQRGPVLEAIVSRMKTISETFAPLDNLRFLAISATVFNVEDLAVWLGARNSPAHFYKFGNDVRPVKLQKIVKGFPQTPGQSAFLFDLQLSYKLKSLILEHARGKPSLVFCSTRKSTLQTAKILSDRLTFHFTEDQRRNLMNASRSLLDSKLKDLIMAGIGYHHAGMTVEDRHLVQNLFVSGALPILVATSTMAMGVNLPAHLVVVKSTQQFKAGRVEEYSESTVLQMIGRAGRPQFDDTAVAVIMTRNETVARYEKLLDSKEIIESALQLHLPEHLNSEIVLRTISSFEVAMEWIRSTFLYVRAVKNPQYYGFSANADRRQVERSLEMVCRKEINGLQKAGLVGVSENEETILPTSLGRLMSRFYLSFDTFKIFLSFKGTETIPEILLALSEAREFSEVRLRVNERRILNDLNGKKNRDKIRFPLKGKVKTRGAKVNCLIQACLGCLFIGDPALHQESIRLVKTAERLAKCLSELMLDKSHHRIALHATVLAKCLHAKLWENSPYVCRQLPRIGATLGALLASCGKTTFVSVEDSNPRDLERILNRAPPFGNHLREAVAHLPKYKIIVSFEVDENELVLHGWITVTLVNADVVRNRNTAGDRHWLVLLLGDTENKLLAHHRFLDATLLQKDFQTDFKLCLQSENVSSKLLIDLISEQWVGIDVGLEIPVRKTALVRKCPSIKSKAKTNAVERREKRNCVTEKLERKSVMGVKMEEVDFRFEVDVEIEETSLSVEEKGRCYKDWKRSLEETYEGLLSSGPRFR